MMMKRVGVVLVAAAVAAVWGCSSDDDKPATSSSSSSSSSSGESEHTSPYPSCQAIIEACHPLDVGDGPIHDCHELGHDEGTEATCAAKKAECLATCVAGDAGSDASTADADHDHSH
ncbi:MAG: hypothetical protein U0270_28025 [Labilithrix sp.]